MVIKLPSRALHFDLPDGCPHPGCCRSRAQSPCERSAYSSSFTAPSLADEEAGPSLPPSRCAAAAWFSWSMYSLGILHRIDVTKPRRAVLVQEQRVEHEGILPMVVEAPSGRISGSFSLANSTTIVHVLAVVQNRAGRRAMPLVIPVHHRRFVPLVSTWIHPARTGPHPGLAVPSRP